MRLAGTTTLITGASSGIGAATATAVAASGARLMLVGRDARRLEQVAERTGGVPIVADLTDPDGVAQVVKAAGRVDVLISNAGQGYAGGFETMPDDRIARLVAVNLTAPLRLTRALLPEMVRRQRGHVVFVTSIAGATGVRGEAVYSAAKGGVAVFADALRQEVSGAGVRVSVVAPGVVDTPFFERRGLPYDRAHPRPIPPERVANAIVDTVERDRAEVFVPGWLRLPARIKGSLPGLYRTLAGRFG